MTRDPMQELIEAVAQAIYEQWKDQDGYEPWAACGNSLKQDDARQIARSAISRAEQAQGVEDVFSEGERHELECLRHRVAQIEYPCSPHCDGYLRELAMRNTSPAPAQPGDLMLCTTTCFECGHELHAPFCPACNPEMVSPVWRPDVEEVARIIEPLAWAALGIGDTLLHKSQRTGALRKAQAILALSPEGKERARSEPCADVGTHIPRSPQGPSPDPEGGEA